MTCTHRLWGDPDGLRCVIEQPNHRTGHVYQASDAPDRHDYGDDE
jgi:hypothetical protein